MSNFKKLTALLLCAAFIFGTSSFAVAEDEFEVEDVEFFTGDSEETEETEYIVRFNDDVVSLYSEDGKDYALMSEEELNAAIEEGIVDSYEENVWVYLYGEEDYDPMQASYKWDVKLIKADYAFDKGYTGSGVKIAVIDSGCNTTGDLSENILTGYNLVEKSTDVTDNVLHGTMVAGQIAAESNSVGFRGVAPNAKIVPLKIFDSSNKAKINLVIDAIYMAVDNYDCDIINMSLGTDSDSDELKAAIDYAARKNVLLIAASGNNGTSGYSYPAAYSEVIGVGAVDNRKNVCDYSQHNDGVTLCAPGGTDEFKISCLSASSNKSYYQSKGTSFAAPLVTGIAAIFRGLDSEFTQEEFLEIIMAASTDLGKAGYDTYYGYGLADIESYLKYYLAPVGDNNADGEVTGADAKRIADYVIGTFSSFVKEEAADVNGDGTINLLDAILVARAAEGWDGYELPYNK